MILPPETARFLRGSERMVDFEKTLRNLGLDFEMVTVPDGAGKTRGSSVRHYIKRKRHAIADRYGRKDRRPGGSDA